MGLFSGHGSKNEKPDSRFLVAGAEVTCLQCQNNLFHEGKAQLNTAAMSLMNLDWVNKSATTLVCSRCSFISWYLEGPTKLD
ncbi:MAG: hypothetical protein QNL88_11010 [Acidobacteriota bacterium]|nr:hypothetical protein [Acidobacteriota bacterium]